jgi:hypothetical protein
MKKLSTILLFLLLFSAAASAQKPSKDGKEYDALVAKLKAGDTSIDFKALRIAFTQSNGYSPYGGGSDDVKAAFAALEKKDYKSAKSKAEKALNDDYIDMDAHVAALLAYKGLGDASKESFHKAIYLGLVNSILNSGDGKTPETAYIVISTHEEYVALRALGLQPAGQSLQHLGQHTFDVMQAVDKASKAETKVYFNIDISWKAETDMFKP